MISIRLVLGSTLLLVLYTSTSLAQAQRTFVSGLGSDGNPCSRTAPCRTFAQATMGTNAGGEVIVLDSAGYGPFTITKPVAIEAPPGVYAGISVFSDAGVTVSAGNSDEVVLRGLTINNVGSAGAGIFLNGVGQLHVESCIINGPFQGIDVNLATNSSVFVKDTIIRNCSQGMRTEQNTASQILSLDRCRFVGNGQGLAITDGAILTIRDSVIAGSTFQGILASSVYAPTEVNVENCDISADNVGIEIQTFGSTTTVRVSSTLIVDNNTGLATSGPGGTRLLISFGNNRLSGNGTNGSFTSNIGTQ